MVICTLRNLVGVRALLEEESDIKCLRQYSLQLFHENRHLTRKLRLMANSLGNQTYTVTMLQENIAKMNAAQSRLSELLGEFAGVAIEGMLRSQTILREMSETFTFEDIDKDLRNNITDLENILHSVPVEYVAHAKARCVRFLHKLPGRGGARNHHQQRANNQVPRARRNANSNQPKRGRKRSHPETSNLSESPSVRQRLPTQFQSNKSVANNGRRNYKRSRMSVSDTEDSRLKKSSQRRVQKRKAEKDELVSEPKFGEESSTKGNAHCDSEGSIMSPVSGNEPCLSHDELNRMKSAVVKLVDVLNDPSLEDDVHVAQFKQSIYSKDSDENEYEIVDDVDTSDEDEEKQSDNCDDSMSDRERDDDDAGEKDNFKASSSQPNEQLNDSDDHADDEAASGASSAQEEEEADDDDGEEADDDDDDCEEEADDDDDEDEEEEEEEEEEKDNNEEGKFNEKENSSPNGKGGGPCTPPSPQYTFVTRGPHTPPGCGPDSEVEEMGES